MVHLTSFHSHNQPNICSETTLKIISADERRNFEYPCIEVDSTVLSSVAKVPHSEALPFETGTVPRYFQSPKAAVFKVRRESCSLTTPSVLGTKVQENRLKRVSAKDAMNLGDKIYLPFSVQEVSSERQECHYNEDEKNYIQSLELYKDPAIIVINKPPGMPVQGGIGIQKSLDVLAATCLKFECSEPPRLVHRLDRDSSGILVMGRTQTSAVVLHSMFREKTFGASTSNTDNDKAVLQRKYWALVLGTPRRASGFISAPLGKVVIDNGKSERITVIDDTKHMPFQHAVTKYRVIEQSLHGYTWLELCPLTGRKHQLRVHCAEVLGTPIVGDYKYGWQAHRKWKPVPWPENKLSEKVPEWKMFPLGHALDSGSITEKQPHLHLHCKRMILPNISLALQYMKSKSKHDFSELESLDLVAPLPSHMQRSWDILRS
ncbi:hypothetical protein GIB67_021916 [Kingdonia uniflora]|uniref:Pseudouridine synthase RsuA/RluA-like domain-containing protein n=1 Tax=Kingdonia uniflora TaxID=39325 RepID=A0A7J7N4C7_9MAGN|nr:hypothetical protein GIB67_021916 [Kingdonia uniflora]